MQGAKCLGSQALLLTDSSDGLAGRKVVPVHTKVRALLAGSFLSVLKGSTSFQKGSVSSS